MVVKLFWQVMGWSILPGVVVPKNSRSHHDVLREVAKHLGTLKDSKVLMFQKDDSVHLDVAFSVTEALRHS